eukprot:GHVQ01032229.1.p1 GENE.GHVQ01032229.1~~GHVQ01032229.1.p1  ORF type:complete len:456 (-),score=68.58 GHVQ01032229.1:577-1944(-)
MDEYPSNGGGAGLAGGVGGGATGGGVSSAGAQHSISREIREEHRIWKFNTLVLYDLVMSHTLLWPSLTVEWVKGLLPHGGGEAGQRLIVGTHTSGKEQNYLMVLEVGLPVGQASESLSYEDRTDYSGFKFGVEGSRKFNVVRLIPHDGEINRASHMPQHPTKIATRSVSGNVLLFDSDKYGNEAVKGTVDATPDIVMTGHSLEGWGMSWNKSREGYITTVADDGKICVWDINGKVDSNRHMDTLTSFTGHARPAQDVCWQEGSGDVIMSVGDDGKLMIWDIRENCRTKPVSQVQGSNLELNAVSNNAFNNDVIVTGGADQEIDLWQLRKLTKPAHRMACHKAAIVRLHFTGYSDKLLASASSDRFIAVWDIDRIGMEQTPEDAEDGPPELVFTHGGHTAPVSDFSWNPEDPYRWMIASVAEDNVLQIWQPSKTTFQDEYELDDAEPEDDEEFAVE